MKHFCPKLKKRFAKDALPCVLNLASPCGIKRCNTRAALGLKSRALKQFDTQYSKIFGAGVK